MNQIAGKLHIEISRLGGTFLDRFADINEEQDDDDNYSVQSGAPMIVRVSNWRTIHVWLSLPKT